MQNNNNGFRAFDEATYHKQSKNVRRPLGSQKCWKTWQA